MEKEFNIKTPDGKVINGILNGSIKKPMILIVHGFASHIQEALHYNAARFFNKHGFSVFRINLYHWRKENRKLHECTLETHGKDIDTVVRFLKSKGAHKISAVGHSYGFPSLLLSNTEYFNTIVSWDGSCLPDRFFDKCVRIQKPIKGRIVDEGYWTIMGEAMVQESHEVDSVKLIRQMDKPMMFISVPKGGGDPKSAKKMFAAANQPKAFVTIKGATHNFFESGKQEELYTATVDWIKKVSLPSLKIE